MEDSERGRIIETLEEVQRDIDNITSSIDRLIEKLYNDNI